MKIRLRSRRPFSSFLLVATLPSAALGMLTLADAPVIAQTVAPPTAPPAAPPPAPPTEPPAPGTTKIGKFVVTGNKKLSATAIILASGHQVGDPCTIQTLSDMQTRLFQTGNFGMHSATPEDAVKVSSQENNPPDGLCTVLIEVDENDPIQGVDITGSGPIKPEEIRPLLHLKSGDIYNYTQFLRDTQDIQELYNKRGYIATFSQDAGIGADGKLNVPIIVSRVAKININKAHKTKRRVILREMRTKEGDYYNRDTLNKDRIRLYNLDLFEDVGVEEHIQPGTVTIDLNLPEKRTGTVAVGVGYSDREQLVGRAEITETNFRGLGETVNLLAEIGGAASRSSIELGFTEPWLDRRQTALSVNVYDKIVYRFANTLQNVVSPTNTSLSIDNRYYETRIGGTVTASRPFRTNYRAALTFRAESVRTPQLDLSAQNALIVQNGPIFAIGGSLLHNTRDLDLDPVAGAYQNVGIQFGHADLQAPKLLNGEFIANAITGSANFAKASAEWRQYYSLSGPRKKSKPDEEKTSLAMRLLLGGSTGTLPFFEQFFVGGAESLRGYREDRFWGNNMLLGSIELRQPLARKLKGVLFMDVGDAWGGPYQNVSIQGFQQGNFLPRAAVGLGVRVGTPLGPIRLDAAVGDEGVRTDFSIGNAF